VTHSHFFNQSNYQFGGPGFPLDGAVWGEERLSGSMASVANVQEIVTRLNDEPFDMGLSLVSGSRWYQRLV
jgi:hypothetical protein